MFSPGCAWGVGSEELEGETEKKEKNGTGEGEEIEQKERGKEGRKDRRRGQFPLQ